MRIVFLHLDLGIGGAEQLVVNLAVSALNSKHTVKIYTTHHDHTHCFAETKGDGILAPFVSTQGDWLPRQILGKGTAICATVRMIYLALLVMIREQEADAIVCDGVSTQLPVLRLMGVPILFYCHFPDKLLCVDRGSLLKRLYRAPLDWAEEVTTGMAHVIAVNSRFTAGVFAEAFKRLRTAHPSPVVLYPPINPESFVTRPDKPAQVKNKKACTSTQERQSFAANVIGKGFHDTFRLKHPTATGVFSFFSARGRAKPVNRGLRIDYICVTEQFKDRVHDAFILDSEPLGTSDHLPVGAVIRL